MLIEAQKLLTNARVSLYSWGLPSRPRLVKNANAEYYIGGIERARSVSSEFLPPRRPNGGVMVRFGIFTLSEFKYGGLAQTSRNLISDRQ